ncbi:putative cytochrome P450 E-class, group IV [Triangularia verruculosa]|uniref:Cytochrome P450 E-class, group IV n=1 Tax=Triangularia verruculosa TaxID=2587418 RepID=A0AAN7AV86_9PEZI|nr:putative cytochrome P450 E-class, group IV [Triangularia verruculosa]
MSLLSSTLLLFGAWIIWRVWRFTLSPLIRPNDPKELPYTIPFIGHAISLFSNSTVVLTKGWRNLSGGDRQPFALQAAGTSLHVISHPKHMAEVFKNTQNFSFQGFVLDILKATGISPGAIAKTYDLDPAIVDSKVDHFNYPKKDKHFEHLNRQLHLTQLSPSSQNDNLASLDQSILSWLQDHLTIQNLQQYSLAQDSLEVNLYSFINNVFIQAGEHAYFGPALSKLHPNVAKNFQIYDELYWKDLYQLPPFLAPALTSIKEKLITQFKDYFSLPREERTAQNPSWFTPNLELTLDALGVEPRDKAVFFLMLYFAANSNTPKLLFWLLAHLLSSPPSYLSQIRSETSPAFTNQNLTDTTYILKPGNCPTLERFYLEVLRFRSNSISARRVTTDTVLPAPGSFVLRKGAKVMIPWRVFHFDETVFGEDAKVFNPERWEHLPASARGSVRPFGGGKSICPGRYLAEREVKKAVALLVRRFDFEVLAEGDGWMPVGDDSRPGVGMMAVEKGGDSRVRIRGRE